MQIYARHHTVLCLLVLNIEYLSVKRKVEQLQVFQESSLQSSSFDDKSLPSLDVVNNTATNCLLRLTDTVVHVQLWIPVFTPVNLFSTLRAKNQHSVMTAGDRTLRISLTFVVEILTYPCCKKVFKIVESFSRSQRHRQTNDRHTDMS